MSAHLQVSPEEQLQHHFTVSVSDTICLFNRCTTLQVHLFGDIRAETGSTTSDHFTGDIFSHTNAEKMSKIHIQSSDPSEV